MFSSVNHFFDILIGRDTGLNAVDIAVEMRMEEIENILMRNGLTGVRCGRTRICDLADEFSSPFTFQRVSDLEFVACNLC